ncbi:rRNA adenine N-6-methyltransferase family protein [Myceligenerans crystallogenes]|uniref:23S rRNA (Adenine(2058)-N(6))-methyltransferase Erm(37) n=1 Tax=Myceligenerans crystallogenes TaxID=316335 RepID=A0ABN2N810_9MICO
MAGQRVRREWGWHQLSDEFARQIVTAAHVFPGDLVLDLGAGTGALTGPLLDAGARVLAVELHPGRARRLREQFAGRDVSVLEIDLADLRLPGRPFRVVANPPYAHTTALVRTLTARGSALTRADLVMQRQAAVRLADRYANSGRWNVTVGRPLPRRAFTPRPRVDSCILTIRPRHRHARRRN